MNNGSDGATSHMGLLGGWAANQGSCAPSSRTRPRRTASTALYDRLPGPRELVRFTAAEGANRNCEPMGMATRDQRIFDWLDRYLAA